MFEARDSVVYRLRCLLDPVDLDFDRAVCRGFIQVSYLGATARYGSEGRDPPDTHDRTLRTTIYLDRGYCNLQDLWGRKYTSATLI